MTINKTLAEVNIAPSSRVAEEKLRSAFNKHLGLVIILRNDLVDWPFVKGLLSTREFAKQASVCYVQALRDRFADIVAAIHKLQILGAEVSEELRSQCGEMPSEGISTTRSAAAVYSSESTPIMTPHPEKLTLTPPKLTPSKSKLNYSMTKGAQTDWSLMSALPPILEAPPGYPLLLIDPSPRIDSVRVEPLLSQTEDLLISPLRTPEVESHYASPMCGTFEDFCPPTRAELGGGNETRVLSKHDGETSSCDRRASQTRRSIINALNSTLSQDDSISEVINKSTKIITTDPPVVDDDDWTMIHRGVDMLLPADARGLDGGLAAKRRKNAEDFAVILDSSPFMNCLNFGKFPHKTLKLICDEFGLKNTTKKETVKQLEIIRDAVRTRYFANAAVCP